MITADHDIALQGSRAYGTEVSPAEFEPLCDAYQRLPSGATYFKAKGAGKSAEVEFFALSKSAATPFPIELFQNITNQPIFANGSSCDHMIRIFDSSLSMGAYEPVFARGRVRANIAPLEREEEWTGVYGVQVATPFIENNYLACQMMQGYSSTVASSHPDIHSAYKHNVDL